MSVSPEHRKQGLAVRLLDVFEREYTSLRLPFVDFYARPSNTHALKIYENLGYMRIALIKRYFLTDDTKEDALIFSKTPFIQPSTEMSLSEYLERVKEPQPAGDPESHHPLDKMLPCKDLPVKYYLRRFLPTDLAHIKDM